jgi:hypothetical protein
MYAAAGAEHGHASSGVGSRVHRQMLVAAVAAFQHPWQSSASAAIELLQSISRRMM